MLKPVDRSFKTFLSNILVAITFADSKMFKSMWLVLSKPGFLSREFAAGRRVNYLKPLSLFFVLNLIYFFFPVIQLFNASLQTQLLSPLNKWYQHLIALKLLHMNMSVSSFQLIYDLKSPGFAKLMVMVFAVVASLPLNLLYRKRSRYFTDNVGLCVELACFNLFVNAIMLSLIATVFRVGGLLNETVLTITFISTNLYFLLRASHTFYHEKGWKLVAKSLVMILILKLSLEVYRTILFFVTLWSM